MRNDFAAFILTNGRPDRLYTLSALRSHGYTGQVYLIVDDEDPYGPEYQERHGDMVRIFRKSDVESGFDMADNLADRRTVTYARNACFDIAKDLGLQYFVQLDDDYTSFYYRFDGQKRFGGWKIDRLDELFGLLVEFLSTTPFQSVAIAQGGDFIGGGSSKAGSRIGTSRKAMNSFFCDVSRPFKFVGRLNDDVNTYTVGSRRGELFLTFQAAMLTQKETQSNPGGLTEIYLDMGTYVKSFYTVMINPSCTKVGLIQGQAFTRLHHSINWNAAAPKIISEEFKKEANGR